MERLMATVLLCDDELMNRKVASKILIKENFKVLEAVNGQNALEILKENRVELILMDLMMPIMDGYKAIEAIKRDKKTSSIPIIVISALSDKEAIIKGLSLGAIDYLTKPFDILDFKLRIKNYAMIGQYQNNLVIEIDKKTKKQLELQRLNKQVTKQKVELDKLYNYDIEQQIIAKEKLHLNIVNDLENSNNYNSSIIYKAADILSGDFYSIHLLKNGAIFAYVLDGQGHGIVPALTIFAVSTTILSLIDENVSFKNIIQKLFLQIQKDLGEIEQLSYTMLYINQKKISYSSGGMYPFMLKQQQQILTLKANNLPFMNFSSIPNIDTIPIDNWNNIIIYTDGLVEEINEKTDRQSPLNILKDPAKFKNLKIDIESRKFEDDITVILLENINRWRD
jgi:CheY-like chemotaxis protein